jgi:nicotianamine synthase
MSLAEDARPEIDPDSAAQQLCARILGLCRQLEAAGDLEPGPLTDLLFRDLVSACTSAGDGQARQVLRDPEIARLAPRLRELCSQGEYRLERHWACSVLSAADPGGVLDGFPYRENYASLVRLELHALAGVGADLGHLGRACFLGGGPLPLSALMLAETLPGTVDVVDRDREAVSLAAGVCRSLASTSVQIHHGEAVAYPGLAQCDLVVMAALVGSDAPEKRALLRDLYAAMRPGSMLVIRSAHGLRTLLYPALDLDDLQGWTPLAVVHPLTEVVNSAVVAVRGRR